MTNSKSTIFFLASALMILSAAITYMVGMTVVVSLGFAASALAFLGAGLNYMGKSEKKDDSK